MIPPVVLVRIINVRKKPVLFLMSKKLNPFSNIWVLLGILSSVLLQIAVVYWKPLQSVFSTTPLSLYQWTMIIMVSGIGFVAMELCKFFISRNPAKT